ncbi:MAG: MBL fold metallo-hydrolase [Bryobacteraceae bacterium]|nr:MBL fold metallo-hydrolase [Bryobacteraceae bacterium]MDW8378034.1 MBL fold metallo-hydrolase [Bryobacterales bacterium]
MSRHSRRHFLQSAPLSAVTAAAGPATAARKPARQARFAPAGAPRRLSENLWLFADTCNVYVIRQGSRCVLIDLGSGKIFDHLRDLEISQVDWILHTHHHRDQCQGDFLATERKIPIAVPAHEMHLFADAENFWRNRRVFHLYYVRNDFNTITENIPVAFALQDYSTFRWMQTDFFILPTPGHTLGSITLLASIDGQRVAFTGDLIYAPGKIQNLYDTQINYGGAEGIDLGIYSLARLREQKPALLCPSHGEPMPDPDSSIAQTIQRLTDYYRFQTGNDPSEENKAYAVSPHLICSYQTTSSFYAIVSNSGKAMFIDYGSASGVHFSNFERATATRDRIRFVEHSIEQLKRDFGIQSIDVAMPSHMHDDHMNGFPHLKRHYGTKIWCYENMVDIFENPRGYNLGCTLAEPFRVDRAFRHGERFRWEEYEFEITHSPGHTEYQMALFVTIDGNRVAFTGDAFFPNPRNDGTLRHNLIFRNHVENDSHLKSIHNLIEHEPTLIAPGHGKPYPVDRQMMLATEQKFRKQQQFFFDLLPEGETDFGLDPSWVKLYPYQLLIRAGSAQTLEVRVQNYRPAAMKMEVALVAPPEWKIEPDVLIFEAPAKSHARAQFKILVPRSWTPPSPRLAIAADVRAGGRYLGQITEAVVDVMPASSKPTNF